MIRLVKPNDRILRRSNEILKPRGSRTTRICSQHQYSRAASVPASSSILSSEHYQWQRQQPQQQQGFRLLHTSTSRPGDCQDFSQGLIPLYPSFPKSLVTDRIGIRTFTSDSKKPPNKIIFSPVSSKTHGLRKQRESVPPIFKEASEPLPPKVGKWSASSQSLGPKGISAETSYGKLFSVYGIVALIGLAVAAPIVVQ